MKKVLFLFFIILIVSCRLDIVEELTSSYTRTKSVKVDIIYPDGCYAYSIVRTNLNTGYTKVLEPGETIESSDSGIVVKAISSYGYLFSEWVGDDIADPQSNATSVLLDTNKTITAKFVVDPNPKKVTVRTRVISGGEIDFGIIMNKYYLNGDIYYSGINVNGEIVIDAIAHEGYTFSHWIGDNIRDVNARETYLKIPKYSLTIEAVFNKIIDDNPESDVDTSKPNEDNSNIWND